MVVYKRKMRDRIGKWLLGFVLFALVLTVTFAQVDGSNYPTADDRNQTAVANQETADQPSTQAPGDGDPGNDRPTDAVPEPMTIVLLGAGLGGMYLWRRRKANQA